MINFIPARSVTRNACGRSRAFRCMVDCMLVSAVMLFALPVHADETLSALVDPLAVSSMVYGETFPLSGYNPLYVLFGDPETKVQLSFKYQIIGGAGLYFGYTQLMFWRLWDDSRPFEDVNYNPEFFYQFTFGSGDTVNSIVVGLYEHKSNGREGEYSRSYDGNYLKFNILRPLGRAHMMISLKAYVLYNLDDPNENIREYMGCWSAELFLGCRVPGFIVDRAGLYCKAFPGGVYGTDFTRGAREVGTALGVNVLGIRPYLFTQYRHGYADSLLHYDRKDSVLRAGFALYR